MILTLFSVDFLSFQVSSSDLFNCCKKNKLIIDINSYQFGRKGWKLNKKLKNEQTLTNEQTETFSFFNFSRFSRDSYGILTGFLRDSWWLPPAFYRFYRSPKIVLSYFRIFTIYPSFMEILKKDLHQIGVGGFLHTFPCHVLAEKVDSFT